MISLKDCKIGDRIEIKCWLTDAEVESMRKFRYMFPNQWNQGQITREYNVTTTIEQDENGIFPFYGLEGIKFEILKKV